MCNVRDKLKMIIGKKKNNNNKSIVKNEQMNKYTSKQQKSPLKKISKSLF